MAEAADGFTVAQMAEATGRPARDVVRALSENPGHKTFGIHRRGFRKRVRADLAEALAVKAFLDAVDGGMRPAIAAMLIEQAMPDFRKYADQARASGLSLAEWAAGRDDIAAWAWRLDGQHLVSARYFGPFDGLQGPAMKAEVGPGAVCFWGFLADAVAGFGRVEADR